MVYWLHINDLRPVQTCFNTGTEIIKVVLEVGNKYKVTMINPTTKKDRKNNNRIVEIIGFTDSFMGDVIVRYLDNNRRGRLSVNCLLPYDGYNGANNETQVLS